MYSLAQRLFGFVLFYGRYIDTQWVGVGEHMAGKKLFQGIIEEIEERTSFIGQDLLGTSQSPRDNINAEIIWSQLGPRSFGEIPALQIQIPTSA